MNKITIPFASALILLTTGCWPVGTRGNREIKTDQRTVSDFSEIKAEGAFEIEWRRGAPALSITTDSNLLQYIDSRVSGNTLRLDTTRSNLFPTRGFKVVVSSANLNGASLSGAVRLTAAQLSGPKFYFESSGAARVTLDGNVDELLADMTGAAKLVAERLQTKSASISATGASKADLSVSDSLKVSITGAGKVTYSGNPKVERRISGAGKIQRRD